MRNNLLAEILAYRNDRELYTPEERIEIRKIFKKDLGKMLTSLIDRINND